MPRGSQCGQENFARHKMQAAVEVTAAAKSELAPVLLQLGEFGFDGLEVG